MSNVVGNSKRTNVLGHTNAGSSVLTSAIITWLASSMSTC